MRTHLAKGFTLVEILIVVVILGILAAIVVPQFTDASQDAIKSALRSQLQTISAQVELYRVQNAGTLPALAADDWSILVDNDYLKDEPTNGYTRSAGLEIDSYTGAPATDGTGPGWSFYSGTGDVYASGYNHEDNLLANETGYTAFSP